MAGMAIFISHKDNEAANIPDSLDETNPRKKTETAPLIPISAIIKDGTIVMTKKIVGINTRES